LIVTLSKPYLMRWLLTVLFVLFSWLITCAQSSIQFNHYTVEHGLSDNIVNDIVQDDNGFTWLATTNGLNRFDGVQFKNFFRTGSVQQIPDNFISRIRKWPWYYQHTKRTLPNHSDPFTKRAFKANQFYSNNRSHR